jgi:hypothetical protein
MNKAGDNNPNWKGGKVTLRCERCLTPFDVIPCREGTARCCSLKCWNELQLLPGYAVGRNRVERVTCRCRQCSEPFQVTPGVVGRRVFCTHSCQFIWRKIRNSGDGNPNWNGGTRSEKYPAAFYAIRSSILARDGRECAVPMCRTDDSRVGVHHIDFDKNNCAPGNLISACPSCNARANFDRDLWKGILSVFLAWRIENGVMNMGFRGSMILEDRPRIEG